MIELTPKAQKFLDEYLKTNKGRHSAIKAGYSARTADAAASRLLKHVKIRAELNKIRSKVQEKTAVDVAYIIRGLKEVVERCLQHAPVMEFDHEQKAMLQQIDDQGRTVWEFDSGGANKAFELLGRHLKMFTERHEHEVGPIQITVVNYADKPSL